MHLLKIPAPSKKMIGLSLYCLLCLLLSGPLYAQTGEFKGVFIWKFKTSEGQTNKLTKSLTEDYEIFLKSNRPGFNVVERRNLNELLIHEESELLLLDDSPDLSISEELKAELINVGASVIVLGTLGLDPYVGQYSLSIKFADLFTKELLFINKVYIEEDDIFNKKVIQNRFFDLLPQAEQVVRTLPLPDTKKWVSNTPIYHEDFSNRLAEDFLGYIWNLKVHSDYEYYVDEDRAKYLFKIKKQSFIRHKYIDGDGILYSMKNPYAVTVQATTTPKCLSTEDCYGRGLTVKYNTGKRSCYAYMLSDDGYLNFMRIHDINKPENSVRLYSRKMDVKPDHNYMLSILTEGNDFTLFFEKEPVTQITDNELQGDKFGVIGYGEGQHYLDDITILEEW